MNPTIYTINNKQYAIYEDAKNGDTVLFLHGNSLSSETFKHQFVPELSDDFHLVAFDFLGHGASGKSASPTTDYSFQGMVNQIKDVVDYLSLEKPILIGNSLGGHIALHYASQIGGIGGIGIFGTPPLRSPEDMESAFLPSLDASILFKPDATLEEAMQLAKGFIQEEFIEEFAAQVIATDPHFKTSLFQDISNWGNGNEVEIVKNLDVPILVLYGEKEAIVSLEYLQTIDFPTLFSKKIHVIKNGKHCTQFSQPAAFNEVLLAFLKSTII